MVHDVKQPPQHRSYSIKTLTNTGEQEYHTFTTGHVFLVSTNQWTISQIALTHAEEHVVGVEVRQTLSKTEVWKQSQEDPFEGLRYGLRAKLWNGEYCNSKQCSNTYIYTHRHEQSSNKELKDTQPT